MSDLTTARVRALQLWFAGLAPEEARAARVAARTCENCVHFGPHPSAEKANHPMPGTCYARPPSPRQDILNPVAWVETWPDMRCGSWEDPALPLTWSSPLSGVELDRAARKLGAEVAEHV